MLNAQDDAARRYRVDVCRPTARRRDLLVARTEHGTTIEKHLHREFFNSAEYRRIAELGATLAGLLGAGAYVVKGDAAQDVATFRAGDRNGCSTQARKGQTDPALQGPRRDEPRAALGHDDQSRRRAGSSRCASRTRSAANEIFTTLMGDQVEPRREFIEKNALEVANLDI